MFNNIVLQLVSFMYIAILSIIYFTKRKYNFVESKIYKTMLVMTMITIVFDTVSILTENKMSILVFIYRSCLFVWLSLFLSYTFLNRRNKKYEKFSELFKDTKIPYIWLSIILILFIILIVSQIKFDIHLIYIYGIVGAILNLIILLFKIGSIPKYKIFSIFTSDIILLITMIIQMNNKDIALIGAGITLITLVQYFIMENPDLKYIDELNNLKNKAEEASLAKTNFLASMSHEIRTPMNVVIGLSQSMLEGNIPDELREDVKNINEAGNILLEIVNNVLDITKVEEGKVEINNKPYSLADTIAKVSHMAEISLMDKPIKFEVKINGQIPSSVIGDELKVYQVLMNIVSNSIKYTKKGSIIFNIESNIVGDKNILTFKISDTGIGIKKADNEKLFQEFERLDQENSDIQGSGLGLVITKRLVTLMGGKISFNSVYGEGTTFTINLEQTIADKSMVDFETFKSNKVSVDKYFDGSSYKVLLVDDNVLNLKVAEKMLKKYNFNVTCVKSGLECINYTKNNNYDIVFMDHMMPEMDGIQTLYNLKRRATGFDTPVVVLTANVTEGSKKMYLNEGFCDYLSKPIDQIELDRVLREQLKIDDNSKVLENNDSNVELESNNSEIVTNDKEDNVINETANSTNTENIDSQKEENEIDNIEPIFP